MSCADVMYQPYSPYFSVYQRGQVSSAATGVSALTPGSVQASSDYRKYCLAKSSETEFSSPIVSAPSECRLRCSAARGSEVSDCRDKERAEAQYLSANCVVFTYYSGDISAVVDEHFSRALGQTSNSYSASEDANQTKSSKDAPPMSHRNFPPSFWNSNYQSSATSGLGSVATGSLGHISAAAAAAAAAGHPDIGYGGDPYHHSTAALLHHQNHDPWHYSFPSQTGHFGHHRTHDLSSYHPGMSTVSGASRFNSQYSSLLLQPSVRSAARLGSAAACSGLEKPAEGWGNARYHDPIGHMESNYAAPYGSMATMTGLEGQPQESKDLYWF